MTTTSSQCDIFRFARKPLRKAINAIRRLRRRVSRWMKGSRNRRKAALKLARSLSCGVQRNDTLHKISSVLARKASLIGIEELHVAGMLKNRRLSQALSDASLSELHRQLRYKAEWHGGVVVAEVVVAWEKLVGAGRAVARTRPRAI